MKIAVFNEKGGAAKTTTAVTLAVHYGLPLLDLDPQATATRWLARREGGHPTADENSADWVADFEPGLSLSARPYLRQADVIVVPVRASFPDLVTLGDTVNFLSASVNENLADYQNDKSSASHNKKLSSNKYKIESANRPIITLLGGDVEMRSSDKDMLFDALKSYPLPILGYFSHRASHRRAGLAGKTAPEIDKIAALELATIVKNIQDLLA